MYVVSWPSHEFSLMGSKLDLRCAMIKLILVNKDNVITFELLNFRINCPKIESGKDVMMLVC